MNSNELEGEVNSLEELCDGHALSELLHQVKPSLFARSDLVLAERNDWHCRLNNLGHLVKGLKNFYSAELGVTEPSLFSAIDCPRIARHQHLPSLISLLELVIGGLVKCKSKEVFISRIMQLSEHVQADMMHFIQNTLEKLEKHMNEAHGGDLQQQKQENRRLEQYLDEYLTALTEFAKRQEAAGLEQQRLVLQIEGLKDDFEQKSSKRVISAKENTSIIAAELEQEIELRDKKLRDLQTHVNDITRNYSMEVANLKDELDVYKDMEIKFSRTENQLESYRKQVEDYKTIKKQLQLATEECDALQTRVVELEALGSATNEQTLNYYKNKYSEEREKAAQLTHSLEEREKSLKEVSEAKRKLEDQKIVQRNEIRLLNEEIETCRYPLDRDSDDSFISISKGLQNDLEDQVKKLERENKLLKAQGDQNPLIDELTADYDKLLIAKKGLEEKLRTERTNQQELARQLQFVQKEYAECQEVTSGKLAELQNELVAASEQSAQHQRELERLHHELADFDKIKTERDIHVVDLKALFKEKDQLTQRLLELKEETHTQQTRCISLEVTLKAAERETEKLDNSMKEAKESERIALNELEVLKKHQGGTTSESEKIKFLELQRDSLKQESEIASLKLTLHERDDSLMLLQREKERVESALLDDLTQREAALSRNFEEEKRHLGALVAQKEHEISYLAKTKEDLTNNWNKEMRLMSSVLHETGLEIMRVNRCFREDKGWLAGKRN